MENEKDKPEWRAFGKPVTGAAHHRAKLPCQDAITWLPESGIGARLTLSISDGHGSAKYFRSDVGADYAVKVFTQEVQALLKELVDPSTMKRILEEQLPKKIVDAWKKAVTAHYQEHKFTTRERSQLAEKEGVAALEAVEGNPVLTYGATVLGVLVTEAFIMYLQLGDGDILTVSETGSVSRPVPGDTRLFANETTSLCASKAWKDCRTHFQMLSNDSDAPALILLSTDGYANSFSSDNAFLKVGSDILDMIRADGLDAVESSVEGWLNDASQQGSGDDITLGILCRIDALLRKEKQPLMVVARQDTPFSTLNEAIRHAAPGTRILVKPGRYAESIVLDKPLEIVGDGPVDQIIIESSDFPCIEMRADYARVRGLTLHSGKGSPGQECPAVFIPRGRLVLTDCSITSDAVAAIFVQGETANPIIRGSAIAHGKAYGIIFTRHCRGRVEECDISANALAGIYIGQGSDPVISECSIHDGGQYGIFITHQGKGCIEKCEIFHNTYSGIEVEDESDPLITHCNIHHGITQGVVFTQRARGILEKCKIYENIPNYESIPGHESIPGQILIRHEADPLILGCSILDGRNVGITIRELGKGTIENCDIARHTHEAISISGESNPVMKGCSIYEGKGRGIIVWSNGRGSIEECHIRNNAGCGLEIAQGGNPRLVRCEIYENQQGILVYRGGERQSGGQGYIEDCRIRNNRGNGVEIIEGANPHIVHCEIYENQQSGLLIHHGGEGRAEDCTIYKNKHHGLRMEKDGNMLMKRCRWYSNTPANVDIHRNRRGNLEECEDVEVTQVSDSFPGKRKNI